MWNLNLPHLVVAYKNSCWCKHFLSILLHTILYKGNPFFLIYKNKFMIYHLFVESRFVCFTMKMFFSPCKLFTAVTPLTCCKQHLKNQSNFVHCGLTKIIFTYQMSIHRQILIFVIQIDTPISQIKRWFWDPDFFL